MALLTIGIAGLVQSFGFIQKAVQLSKNKTLASNLAQEKMQILKQKTYYQVLVTSNPIYNNTDFLPDTVGYDTGYFPPEQITEGGVSYTRYTLVESVKETDGALGPLGPGVPDVGMKRITVTVTWGSGTGKRKATLRSILTNPDTITANSIFRGVVSSTSGVAIGGALVSLVEAPGYSDTTDSLGVYNINTTPGTYTLMVSATGYYSQAITKIVAAGESQPNTFSLTRIVTASITGYPWLQDHLVISQIVGSTIDVSVTPNFDQEYVEVFNPTTYTWTMNGNIGLKLQRSGDTKKAIKITYLNPSVASGSYYLFANTTTINAGGINMDVDAVWDPANAVSDFPYFAGQGNTIPVDEDGGGEGGGALELYRVADGAAFDRVGWNKTGYPAPFYEGQAIAQTVGLSRNELYARKSTISDSGAVSTSYGPSLDSDNNNDDFVDYSGGINLPPHSSYSPAKTMLNGSPAFGAVVSCSDGLSASAQAIRLHPGGGTPDFAYFNLVNVATGTWNVYIASSTNALPLAQSVVTVSTAGLLMPMATFLTEYRANGYVSGRVRSTAGVPLSNITVTAPGATNTSTAADGTYRISVPPGVTNVTVNPFPGGTALYVTASSDTISVQAGVIHANVDFLLYQGGRVSGFVTRDGYNALPGVAMAILDWNSVARDQQVSDSNGRFTSVVLSTGLYTVYPSLGILETSLPASSTVTIASGGGALFSSTFTISNALGYISGSVTRNGLPINTGVLVLVTTATFTTPPDLSINTLSGSPFYLASSGENGTYLAEVRGSTYTVYAYMSVPNSTGTVVFYSSSAPNIAVTPGQTHSGVNFSW